MDATAKRYANLELFVDELQSGGRYSFAKAEVSAAVTQKKTTLGAAISRLISKGRLFSPRRHFFVIVPTEYSKSGAPPPSWYVDDLMGFIGQPYYVGLLSAAGLQGASHQQAMTFQVITDRPTREIVAGRTRLEFHVSAQIPSSPVLEMNTDTGSMRVSTPEVTAFDLVRYVDHCGGWNNIATVLLELSDVMEGQKLGAVAMKRKVPEIQRLGYILDAIGRPAVSDHLIRALATRRYRPVILSPRSSTDEKPSIGIKGVAPWRVIPNVNVEPDL